MVGWEEIFKSPPAFLTEEAMILPVVDEILDVILVEAD
jgi:hypothetical protein